MKLSIESVKQFLINTLIVSICCFFLGLIRYGILVFDLSSLASIFLFYGVVSAPLFYAFRDHSLLLAIILFCLIIVLDEFLLMYPITFNDFINGFLFALARAVSLYVFFKIFYSKNRRALINPIILATLLIIFTLFAQLFFAVFLCEYSIATTTFWVNILHQLVPRFIAGIGLGIGFWVADHPIIVRMFRLSGNGTNV